MTLTTAPELAAMLVHVVVREFPETVEVFRGHGVDLARHGAVPVSGAAGDADAGPLLDALVAAIRWRVPGG
ncbi:MAG TPA: hypothetical protein VF192_01760 [Longimicrobiales bacterium]